MPTRTLERTRKREQQIVGLHALGTTTRQIAEIIGVTSETVLVYMRRLKLKPNRGHYKTDVIYSIKTLPECDTCSQPDCTWCGGKECPEQIKRKKEAG